MRGYLKKLTVLMLAFTLAFAQPASSVDVNAKTKTEASAKNKSSKKSKKTLSYEKYIKKNGVYYKKMSGQLKSGYKEGRKQFKKNDWKQAEYSQDTLVGKQWFLADHVVAYKMDGALTPDQAQRTFKAAEKIYKKAKGKKGKYKKAKVLHDELIKTVTYGSGEYSGQTAYEALVNKQSVCAGYARAYKLLCDLAGIECFCVYGNAGGGLGGGGAHQWNVIKLDDGKWYEVDVTFDDGLTQGGNICREFFCLTTAEMSNLTTKSGTSSYHQRGDLGNDVIRSLMAVTPEATGTKY